MGTSTNYKAPTSPQWSNLKRKVTRVTRQGIPSPDDIQGLLQDFVTVNYGYSQGAGSGGSTGRARAAQDVARNIGGFFSSVADIGFLEAFEKAKLGSLEGKSVSEIRHALLDYLGGPSSTFDRADARAALRNLIRDILGDAHSVEEVKEAMEAMSHSESLADIIQKFFGYCIFEQFRSTLYEHLVARIGDIQAEQSIVAIRRYIFKTLRRITRYQDLSQIDWHGSQGQQIVDKILQNTFKVFST